ncbi:hypothetical protein B0J13DRAFT_538457 [Dactylonectria estremocensis]|uniref:Uncharacterized protein n=1 Tax=Dactylonectria estremocensis TaxID=1079267 RepID=A0A9P9FLS8_9HYPO|nr:hypothetical protein B0J13DRAFT_538457 [Dactylonectria estremocensis]
MFKNSPLGSLVPSAPHCIGNLSTCSVGNSPHFVSLHLHLLPDHNATFRLKRDNTNLGSLRYSDLLDTFSERVSGVCDYFCSHPFFALHVMPHANEFPHPSSANKVAHTIAPPSIPFTRSCHAPLSLCCRATVNIPWAIPGIRTYPIPSTAQRHPIFLLALFYPTGVHLPGIPLLVGGTVGWRRSTSPSRTWQMLAFCMFKASLGL